MLMSELPFKLTDQSSVMNPKKSFEQNHVIYSSPGWRQTWPSQPLRIPQQGCPWGHMYKNSHEECGNDSLFS